MFRGLIVVEDAVTASALEQLAVESRLVWVKQTLHRIPPPFQLTQIVNAAHPEIVFIETDGPPEMVAAVREIRNLAPKAAIVEVRTGRVSRREALTRTNPRALLALPFSAEEYGVVVEHAMRGSLAGVQKNLWALLPAKAGSGASTVTLHTAGALARDLEKKALVIEGDLYSGVISDVMGVEPKRAVVDLLERAPWLEDGEWRRAVTHLGGVDFLLTTRTRKATFPLWSEWYKLLEFVRPRYDAVLVDLPEVINDATVEVARRANRVWIVCTTEVQSLALVRQRRKELITRGIPTERIEVLVNRWHKSDPNAAAIEDLLGQTVAGTLRNDYKVIRRATVSGQFVDSESELGRGYSELANKMCGTERPKPGLLERLNPFRG